MSWKKLRRNVISFAVAFVSVITKPACRMLAKTAHAALLGGRAFPACFRVCIQGSCRWGDENLQEKSTGLLIASGSCLVCQPPQPRVAHCTNGPCCVASDWMTLQAKRCAPGARLLEKVQRPLCAGSWGRVASCKKAAGLRSSRGRA